MTTSVPGVVDENNAVTTAEQRVLSLAAAQLENVAGVDAVTANFIDDDRWGPTAAIEVTVDPAVTNDGIRLIASMIKGTFAAPALARVYPQAALQVTGDASGRIEQHDFTLSGDDLVENFAHWRELQETLGSQLLFTIYPPEDDQAYWRTIGVHRHKDAASTTENFITNFSAVATLTGNDAVLTDWEFKGFYSSGALPPIEIIQLFADVQKIVPLAEYVKVSHFPSVAPQKPEGVNLMWGVADRTALAPAISISHNVYRDEDWAAAIEVAIRVFEVEGLNISYAAGEHKYTLHTSTCDDMTIESSDDHILFDAVVANGGTFLAGAGPGECRPER